MKRLLVRWAWCPEILVGLVFLLGAWLKAIDINTFSVQIYAYGVIGDKSWLPVAALFTVTVEFLVGFALVFGLRFRYVTYFVLEGMLVVFTGLILYGWLFHDLADCGCFGALEISPGASIAKNVVLFGLGLLAWVGRAIRGEPRPLTLGRCLIGLVTLLLTGAIVGYAYQTLNEVKDPTQVAVDAAGRETGVFSDFVAQTDQGLFDLGVGEYLVAMLSMDCEHCMEEVPKLNQLMYLADVPQVVALCLVENDGDMETFRALTQPEFPMHPIVDQPLTYFTLIGEDTFRVYYARDGRALKFWDGHPPEHEALLAAMGGEAAEALPEE